MESALEARILSRDWFYEFALPSGRHTRSYLPDHVKSIHKTRERMVFDFLARRVGDRWSELRCLDVGCHEGYFALQLALRGCREVLGVDARQDHVDHATLIRDLYSLENLSFHRGNIMELVATGFGEFDIVLVFGLLYHVPDVVASLRTLRGLTRKICIIETQVAPELPPLLEWGSAQWTKAIEGCFAVVDESTELLSGNQESSIETISFVPSRNALAYLLPRLGFNSVDFLVPPVDGNEQLFRGVRVMVAAEVTQPDKI